MTLSHELVTTVMPIAELKPHKRNPRHGDIPRIKESLQVLGQYRPIVVNKGTFTGRRNEILAGHHLVMAATELEWTEVAVTLVDVDDETGRRILLVDNRTSDTAEYDERLLVELLETLPDLDGTGYDPGDFELLSERVKADLDQFPDYSDVIDDGKDDAGSEVACPKCGHKFLP